MGGKSGKKVRPTRATTRTTPQRTAGLTSRRNAATLRRFYNEVFNKGNVDRIDELCAPDFVEHEETPGFDTNREGVKQFVKTMRTAFPDITMTVEDMIAAGNKVIARVTMSGTHQGDFMGIPASGKSFSVSTIDIVRFRNGKAAEHWGATDTGKMMEQLGATAGPGPGPTEVRGQVEQQEQSVVVTAQVEDITKWEGGFRTHGDHFRNNMGVTRPINFAIDGNEVAVCFEPVDTARFLAAMQTPENIAAMEQDGVKRETVKVYVMDKEFRP